MWRRILCCERNWWPTATLSTIDIGVWIKYWRPSRVSTNCTTKKKNISTNFFAHSASVLLVCPIEYSGRRKCWKSREKSPKIDENSQKMKKKISLEIFQQFQQRKCLRQGENLERYFAVWFYDHRKHVSFILVLIQAEYVQCAFVCQYLETFKIIAENHFHALIQIKNPYR